MSKQAVPSGFDATVDKQTYSSTMSFVGITRRATGFLRHHVHATWAKVLMWFAVIVYLLVMYLVIFFWYAVVFVLFGLLTFPFRLIRRGQRKQTALQRQMLATQQAVWAQGQRQTEDERARHARGE